jgi:bacterioferritin
MFRVLLFIIMKGDAKVIDILNEILTGELTTINQYFLHARMCKNWGYERLGEKIRKESIDEIASSSASSFWRGCPTCRSSAK